MEYIKLKKIATYPTGKLNSNAAEEDGIYPFFTCSHDIYRINSYAYDGEYVLLGGNNATGDFPIFYYNGKFNAYQRTYLIQPKDIKQFDTRYLFYSIGLKLELMQSNAAGTATRFLTQPILDNINIESRPLPTQQKIASILSAYDNLIQNYKKQIEDLQTTASELYKEWFVRFRFPGYKTAQFENGIPVGWKVEKLEDFGITLESGSRPSGGVDTSLEEGIPSLGAECINGLAEFDYSNVKYIPADYYEKMKRGKNKGNHILVYKDGAYIGKVTLFRNKFPFEKYAINEHVFFLNTNNSNYLNWLYFTLKQESYFNLMQNLNRNAAQPGLSQPDIGRIKIRIPSEDAVIKFNEFVEPIFNTVFDLARANQNLAKQRDLLLPRLMSGTLEVK